MVQKENFPTYHALANLKADDGKRALKPAHLRIIEYIGSFPKGRCFATDSHINSESMGATSPKTIRMHLAYLVAVGALKTYPMGRKRILELALPAGPVISQRNFRVNRKMSEYSYAQKPLSVHHVNMTVACSIEPSKPQKSQQPPLDQSWFYSDIQPQKEALFLSKEGANFASEKDNFTPKKANFAPILREATEIKTNKEKNLPPKRSPLPLQKPTDLTTEVKGLGGEIWGEGFEGSLRDPDGMLSHPMKDDYRRLNSESRSDFNQEKERNEDPEMSEPIFVKKTKQPKTAQEKRAEAVRLSNAGHLVSPLGRTNNRKKKLKPKLACDIEPTGKVTTAQLWKHLVNLWNDRFGVGLLEKMVSTDKSAVASMFENLQQQFIKTCDEYKPDNRELSQYFDWFLDPKRLTGMLSFTKFDKNTMVHWNALAGSTYIRKFYDQHILPKRYAQEEIIVVSGLPEAKINAEKKKSIRQSYAKFRNSYDDAYDFGLEMIRHGYVFTAQFLHEDKELTEDEIREKIIQTMVYLLQISNNKKSTVETLQGGLRRTEELMVMMPKRITIWYDWKEKTKGLIETAIEKSGIDPNEGDTRVKTKPTEDK